MEILDTVGHGVRHEDFLLVHKACNNHFMGELHKSTQKLMYTTQNELTSVKWHMHVSELCFLAGFLSPVRKFCAGWKHRYKRVQDSYTNTLAIVVSHDI